MADIRDYIDVQFPIQAGLVALPPLNTQLFLVDHADVPIDKRFRYISLSSWDDDLTADGIPYKYSAVWFGQPVKPSEFILGRWVSVDSNPYFTSGPALQTDYTEWVDITDGEFRATVGATPYDITGISFAGITALSQIAGILTTAIQTFGAPFATSVFEFDILNRLVLRLSTSGSGADSVVISAIPTPSGTDLSSLMDADNGVVQEGLDAESPQAALQVISAIDDRYYNIHIRGESPEEALALAAWVNTKEKLLDLVSSDVNCFDPASTGDIAYQVRNFGYGRTKVYFHTTAGTTNDQFIDAGNTAIPITYPEGESMYCNHILAGVTDSGGSSRLTVSEVTALEDKFANYAVTFNNGASKVPVDFSGNGVSKRLMHGRDYGVARTRLGIFNYTNVTEIQAYDNDTIAAIEAILRDTMGVLLNRRIVVDTPERPISYNFPDADDISAEERATHVLRVTNGGSAFLNTEVFRYVLYFNFRL